MADLPIDARKVLGKDLYEWAKRRGVKISLPGTHDYRPSSKYMAGCGSVYRPYRAFGKDAVAALRALRREVESHAVMKEFGKH